MYSISMAVTLVSEVFSFQTSQLFDRCNGRMKKVNTDMGLGYKKVCIQQHACVFVYLLVNLVHSFGSTIFISKAEFSSCISPDRNIVQAVVSNLIRL